MKSNFVKRILTIYRRDKIAIFFSFFALLITLLIYIFFLRDNIVKSIPYSNLNAKNFVDLWMIAGLISIVSISSSLAPFEQKIKDNLSNKNYDFIVNRKMSELSMSISYLLAAIIEAFISTFLFIVVAYVYLYIRARSLLSIDMFLQTIYYSLLLVVFGCLFLAVCFLLLLLI